MYNIWVLDLRAKPPAVVGHADATTLLTIRKAAQALTVAFPGPEYTFVHQVNCEPLNLREEWP